MLIQNNIIFVKTVLLMIRLLNLMLWKKTVRTFNATTLKCLAIPKLQLGQPFQINLGEK